MFLSKWVLCRSGTHFQLKYRHQLRHQYFFLCIYNWQNVLCIFQEGVIYKPNIDIFVSCNRMGVSSLAYNDKRYICVCLFNTYDLQQYLDHNSTCTKFHKYDTSDKYDVKVSMISN